MGRLSNTQHSCNRFFRVPKRRHTPPWGGQVCHVLGRGWPGCAGGRTIPGRFPVRSQQSSTHLSLMRCHAGVARDASCGPQRWYSRPMDRRVDQARRHTGQSDQRRSQSGGPPAFHIRKWTQESVVHTHWGTKSILLRWTSCCPQSLTCRGRGSPWTLLP